MHQRLQFTAAIFAALVTGTALGDVDIVSQEAGITVNAIADGESDSVTLNITANDPLPYQESRVSENVGGTIRAESDAALFSYAANSANGLSLTSSGAFDVAAQAAQSDAIAVGVSGFSIRFDVQNPSTYSAVGSLFRQNATLLGEDDSFVTARLQQVDTSTGDSETLWEIVAGHGDLTPVNLVNQLLDENAQYILSVQAFGFVQAVAPDVPSRSNNGSFEIDFELNEAPFGDANVDGVVDIEDLIVLATYYGQTTDRLWLHGDFDDDGDVDLNDLSMLAAHYNAGSAQALADFQSISNVPEPATAAIVLACALLAKRRRPTCVT